jgi:hypothetical protein
MGLARSLLLCGKAGRGAEAPGHHMDSHLSMGPHLSMHFGHTESCCKWAAMMSHPGPNPQPSTLKSTNPKQCTTLLWERSSAINFSPHKLEFLRRRARWMKQERRKGCWGGGSYGWWWPQWSLRCTPFFPRPPPSTSADIEIDPAEGRHPLFQGAAASPGPGRLRPAVSPICASPPAGPPSQPAGPPSPPAAAGDPSPPESPRLRRRRCRAETSPAAAPSAGSDALSRRRRSH